MTWLERFCLSLLMIYVIAYDTGIVHSGFWNDLLNGMMIAGAIALPFQVSIERLLTRWLDT